MPIVTPKTNFISLLVELIDYLDDRSDIADVEYGTPVPNRAMRLKHECEVALAELEDILLP